MSLTRVCAHCDGTGWIYEPCGCYECEYDDKHGRDIPCANCQREIVDCPRCDKGTVKQSMSQTPMWWQVQHLRCSYCGGTGRIYADTPKKETP